MAYIVTLGILSLYVMLLEMIINRNSNSAVNIKAFVFFFHNFCMRTDIKLYSYSKQAVIS